MLKTIEFSRPTASPDSDGVGEVSSISSPVIKRCEIERANAVTDLFTQAQARADEVIQQAQQEAIEIRAAAFREGVVHGVRVALEPMLAMISHWESVNQSSRAAIANALGGCMEDLFGREPTLSALLEMLLSEHMPDRPERVKINVPAHADGGSLQSRCDERGIAADVEVGPGSDQFSVAWGGHVWTAHLGEFSELVLSEALLQSAGVSEADVAEICRAVLVELTQQAPAVE